MTPVAVIAAGIVLLVAGLAWWLGPVALIVSGVVLVIVGLLVDEEALRGKPAQPPPR